MKRIFALCLAFVLVVNTSNAAFTETKTETEKKESYGAFKNAETRAAAELFVSLSRQDYEKAIGKHLSLVERAAFKVQQKRMRQELKRATGDSTGAVIGFLSGLILSLVGVLLVYLLSNDSNMHKWAWIGALVSFLIYGAIII